MDLTPYVDDLQERLAVAAGASGEEARELAERLVGPLDAAVRLVLLGALSTAAGEISAELAPGSVDLRLRAGDPEFVVLLGEGRAGAADGPGGASTPPGFAHGATDAEEGATSRTTLRLPDHLKARVETAAAHDGVSVNTWLVRAVAGALEQQTAPPTGGSRRSGGRITGWVK